MRSLKKKKEVLDINRWTALTVVLLSTINVFEDFPLFCTSTKLILLLLLAHEENL